MKDKVYDEILSFFPSSLSEINFLNKDIIDNAEEIRIRIGQPLNVRSYRDDVFLKKVVNDSDILKLLENFSENSIYTVQNEINSGYITLRGGHRVGISGTSIIENNLVKNIKYISSLNIRIAREVIGCGNETVNNIYKKNTFENTLIISPPRMWKDNTFKRHD